MNLPRYPGPDIPLMQAGGSALGVDFAGQLADMVFGMTPDMSTALEMRRHLSERTLDHGRQPRDVRLLPGLSLYLGHTRDEAQALFLATHARVSRVQRMAHAQAFLGRDLRDCPANRRITLAALPADHISPRCASQCEAVRCIVRDLRPTPDELLARPEILASAHWQVIGTVDDAATEISDWFKAGAIDGFIAVPGGSRQSLDLLLDGLIPQLMKAGLFRAGYRAATLRGHLGE